MIVDTSALFAIYAEEPGQDELIDAIFEGCGFIPAPVLVEFQRVTSRDDGSPDPDADLILRGIIERGFRIEAFTNADAVAAVAANEQFGTGNGRGGKLNLLDLMVYGMAQRMGLPILCTGKDFSSTDAAIHPASRTG